ncbi:MAG TPA: hypothetical protein VMI75_01810 [Polyangiaceae bacterium]|nr:hypothetical protein [Polyangiaceae bacterium]
MRGLLALPLVAAAVACASHPPSPAPAQPPADGRTQLHRVMDRLKEPSDRAVRETQQAGSVIDAIGGTPQMQGDGGVTAE